MNKLYPCFYCSSYKGGELHSKINMTLEEVVGEIVFDVDFYLEDFIQYILDEHDEFDINDNEEISRLELIKYATDEDIKNYCTQLIYPGNIYAFDSYSDYNYYSSEEDGKLSAVDPINDPDFCETFRKVWNDTFKNDE